MESIEVPRSKKAKTTRPADIAELQAELERCKIERDKVVREMKSALEWAYSDKTIPREYWLGKGHTREYAGAMGSFLDDFKGFIKTLRTGTAGKDLAYGTVINLYFYLRDEEGGSVFADHDDILMPYWQEFSDALIHWSEYYAGKEEALQVTISCIQTPDAVLDVLRPAMKRSNVYYLGFNSDGTPKSWNLAEYIGDVVQTNHLVTGVGFIQVVLSNEEWKTICNAIRKRNAHQTSIVNVLMLRKCFAGGINSSLLDRILTSSIEDIDLEENGMSSREASIIAGFLESNPPLEHLNLEDNSFNDADATLLANTFSSNTNLVMLHVDRNNIKDEGRLAFLRAIFDVSSLAACAASNHTCQVDGFDMSVLNYRRGAASNKWDKIFAMLALSGEDSFINTALLGGVPASLMPLLLCRVSDQGEARSDFIDWYWDVTALYLELTGTERCGKHNAWDNLKDKRPLSCMYELIRGWVVPSIYV